MKKNEYFSDLDKLLGNDYAGVVEDGTMSDVSGYIDSGSYALNALLSGSIYKGLPGNKITALAGIESVGKTYVMLAILKNFLDMNKDGLGIVFESEGSITKEIMDSRGIDVKRVYMIPVETVQQFKTQCTRVVESYLTKSEEDRKPLFLALDSLGMLSTTKEMDDSGTGKEVRDMTRTQEIKSAFRTLTLRLSKAKIPMVVTNHVYQLVGSYVPTKEHSGGAGLKYAASSIVELSKTKAKDDEGKITGVLIKSKLIKSRLVRENQIIQMLLSFNTGLDRYYGLLDFAIDSGAFEKNANRIRIDGKCVSKKQILASPEKYYTKEVLDKIDQYVGTTFLFGQSLISE